MRRLLLASAAFVLMHAAPASAQTSGAEIAPVTSDPRAITAERRDWTDRRGFDIRNGTGRDRFDRDRHDRDGKHDDGDRHDRWGDRDRHDHDRHDHDRFGDRDRHDRGPFDRDRYDHDRFGHDRYDRDRYDRDPRYGYRDGRYGDPYDRRDYDRRDNGWRPDREAYDGVNGYTLGHRPFDVPLGAGTGIQGSVPGGAVFAVPNQYARPGFR